MRPFRKPFFMVILICGCFISQTESYPHPGGTGQYEYKTYPSLAFQSNRSVTEGSVSCTELYPAQISATLGNLTTLLEEATNNAKNTQDSLYFMAQRLADAAAALLAMAEYLSGGSKAVPLSAYAPTSPTTAPAAPPTLAPQTYVPPTSAPQTYVPPTSAPQTYVPPTSAPQTYVPPTSAPQTYVPPTSAPQTYVPPTSAPQPYVPPTSAPQTYVPPTSAPQTYVPPISAPPTSAPTSAPTAASTAAPINIASPSPTSNPTPATATTTVPIKPTPIYIYPIYNMTPPVHVYGPPPYNPDTYKK